MMKTIGLVILAVALLVSANLVTFVFAQTPIAVKADDAKSGAVAPASGTAAVVGMPQGMVKGAEVNVKCRMASLIGANFSTPSMLALPDGSIVVLVRNDTLIKYDANLNLVKEVKIKTDFDSLQKEADDLAKECPLSMGYFPGVVPPQPVQTTDVPKRR